MKAKILDIEKNKVTIKTEEGEFITIAKSGLKFDSYIGEDVVIEKNDDKIYVLPAENLSEEMPKDQPNNKKAKHKNKKHKKLVFICLLLILCVAIAAPVSIVVVNNLREQGRSANLEDCLNQATFGTEFLKDQYSQKIECQKKYGGQDADERIAEYEANLNEVLANECAFSVRKNYAVSDEEWESGKENIGIGLSLLKRVKSGYEAEKACYKDVSNYDTSSIDAKISETQSQIEYVESLLQSGASRQTLNCITNTIGNSTFTNCY